MSKSKDNLSRREFLRNTGLVVSAAALGGSVLSGHAAAEAPAEAKAELQWDYEADVVVIGSGGAGLPAALKAQEDGASVIIVEAVWDVGGHAAVSGGNLHSGAGTEFQAKFGIHDTPDMYYTDHTEGGCLATRFHERDYVRAVADQMAECFDFCIANGLLLQDREPTMRDPWDSEAGGTEPERTPRWTYADATTEEWVGYFGGSSGGLGITRPLERSFREKGGKILLNYHMDKIIREDHLSGRVLGIEAGYTPTILPGESTPLKSLWDNNNIESTKEKVTVKANKGVVITTGGSTGNVLLRTAFDPRLGPEFDGLSGMPFSDQDGSGEIAAMAVGASLGTMASYMQHGGHQIAMIRYMGCQYGYSRYREESPIWKLIRANGLAPDYDSLCIVNMLGQRCGNEDKGAGGTYSYDSYEFFNTALCSVLAKDENGVLTRYGGPLWAIFDQDAVERNEWTMEQGVVDFENGYCFKGETLEELANNVVNKYYEHVKMDPEILVEQIKRYNGFVDAKEDTDWGKQTLGFKIEKGPFYAAWATPSLHDCYSGLRCNGDMQVMDIFGKPIPGLFAGGECTGGMRIHGFGRVMTSGYIAGQSAAKGL